MNLIPSAKCPGLGGVLQRQCACGQHTIAGGGCAACSNDRHPLQRATRRSDLETGNAAGVPPIVHEALRSPGKPLDPSTRAYMEPRFGHDFSHVRIHTDARAAASANSVNAAAYTVGKDIVFGAEMSNLNSRVGHQVIAHELVHVMQQSSSASSSAALSVDPVHSVAEREADVIAQDVLGMSEGQSVRVPSIQVGARPLAVNRTPTFMQNCNEYDRCNVVEPLKAANQLVDRAITELTPLASGAVQNGRIVDLLNVHFHDPSNVAGRATIVLGNFRAIKTELNATIRFVCHPPAQDCASARGVGGAFTGDQPGDDISLCSAYHSTDCPEQARMLIHETCHHIPATRIDHAYVHEPKYMALTADQATENPDSYAQFSKMTFMGTPACKDCSAEVQLRPGHY